MAGLTLNLTGKLLRIDPFRAAMTIAPNSVGNKVLSFYVKDWMRPKVIKIGNNASGAGLNTSTFRFLENGNFLRHYPPTTVQVSVPGDNNLLPLPEDLNPGALLEMYVDDSGASASYTAVGEFWVAYFDPSDGY